MEDEDEPLDLLDKKSLANISSTKPLKQRGAPTRTKAKVDLDGKLLLGDDSEDDAMVLDTPANEEDGGVGAYVQALKGKDAVQRGQRGKLKFSNKRSKDDEEMEVDDEDVQAVKKAVGGDRGRGGRGGPQRGGRGGDRGSGGRGGKGAIGSNRRGLGEQKRSGGDARVGKPQRGGRGGRR